MGHVDLSYGVIQLFNRFIFKIGSFFKNEPNLSRIPIYFMAGGNFWQQSGREGFGGVEVLSDLGGNAGIVLQQAEISLQAFAA